MVTFSAVICCLINYVLATPRGSKALKREIELFQATCHGLTSYVVPKGLSLTAVLVLCSAAKLWTLRAGAAHLFVPPFRNHTHRRQYIALRQSQGISHHLCHKAAPTLRSGRYPQRAILQACSCIWDVLLHRAPRYLSPHIFSYQSLRRQNNLKHPPLALPNNNLFFEGNLDPERAWHFTTKVLRQQ